MRDTQSPTGAYPGVAPLAQYGASPTDMNRLGWSDVELSCLRLSGSNLRHSDYR